jgi:hypothetical protein
LDRGNAMLADAEAPDWANPLPVREGVPRRPLIEAADMFPALEERVLDAKRSVWLSFRIFDPDTATRSDRAPGTRVGGLVGAYRSDCQARGRGAHPACRLRAGLADHLHAGSWHTYLRIAMSSSS